MYAFLSKRCRVTCSKSNDVHFETFICGVSFSRLLRFPSACRSFRRRSVTHFSKSHCCERTKMYALQNYFGVIITRFTKMEPKCKRKK